MTLRRLGIVAAAVALSSSSQAWAEAPSVEARARAGESFRQAQAAFERREFAAAAAAFEAAAGFVPHPAALLSAADAWDRAGDAARAADDCDHALALAALPGASSADRVDYAHDARQCLDRLRPRAALLDVRGPVAFAIRVDDGPEQVLPVHRWVRPGPHVLTIVDLDASSTRQQPIDLAPGDQRLVEIASRALAPSPAAPPPAPVARTHRLPASTWVALGVAVPAAVAYGVFAAMTVKAQHDFDAGPTADTRSTFYRDRTGADVAFAIGAAAVAAGLVFWLASPSTPAPDAVARTPGVVRF